MRDFCAHLQAELAALAAADRLRACPELAGASRTRPRDPTGAEQPLLSFASNDYLGLAGHPVLRAAADAAAGSEGFGAGAARLVSGDLPAHRDLEQALATFLHRPAALLFSTGYQANLGVITALAGPEDLIASDAANHASLIDGCRLSRATVAIYAHADPAAAREVLTRPGGFRRRFLVTESLFSMDGDFAPMSALAEVASASDAVLVVDEAHALGTLGPGGRGLSAAAGVDPDVLIGTLGKAFGAAGGFVTGAGILRDYLVNHARTFIFTTAPPPPVAAAARAAVALIAGPEGHQRRERLARNIAAIGDHLGVHLGAGRGSTPRPTGPILPVILGSDSRALDAAASLRAEGLFVPAIRPPTVPKGTARLRVTLSSEHTDNDLEALGRALTRFLP